MHDDWSAFEFPEWLMPEDPNVDPPMSDYKALAEWYWAHLLEPESHSEVRLLAASRREFLVERGFDLDDESTVEALWHGWHHAQKSTMNFLASDCEPEETAHMLVHAVRNFQWNSIVMLLTMEPDTPDPVR